MCICARMLLCVCVWAARWQRKTRASAAPPPMKIAMVVYRDDAGDVGCGCVSVAGVAE